MLTKKQAYEIARTIRPNVFHRPIRERPPYDAQLIKDLENCWVFETPLTGEIIGASLCVAVNKLTGKAFEFGFGE